MARASHLSGHIQDSAVLFAVPQTELEEKYLARKPGEQYSWWQKRFHQVFANMRDSHEALKGQELAELLNKLIDISADGIDEARERDKMLSDIRKRQAETRRRRMPDNASEKLSIFQGISP